MVVLGAVTGIVAAILVAAVLFQIYAYLLRRGRFSGAWIMVELFMGGGLLAAATGNLPIAVLWIGVGAVFLHEAVYRRPIRWRPRNPGGRGPGRDRPTPSGPGDSPRPDRDRPDPDRARSL